jgi:ferric iron reductase protein FhuF
MVVLGYAARLVGPAVAALVLDGIAVDLRPERVRYSYAPRSGFRLATVAPAGWRGPAGDLRRYWCAGILDGHLRLLVDAVRAEVPVAAGLLWGNVASGLAGALLATDPPRARSEGALLLEYGPLRGTGTFTVHSGRIRYRRRSCCLFYRLPGGGYCGDCPLSPDPPTAP